MHVNSYNSNPFSVYSYFIETSQYVWLRSERAQFVSPEDGQLDCAWISFGFKQTSDILNCVCEFYWTIERVWERFWEPCSEG